MQYKTRTLLGAFAILLGGFLLAPSGLHAARMMVSPSDIGAPVGETITISIEIDTEDTAINAAEALIRFPNDFLEAVSVDREGSVFAFWVEEPAFSNENGTISFVGGSARGVTGDALKIITATFKVVREGSGEIDPAQSVVTASDGKGTNVLSSVEKARVATAGEVAPPAEPELVVAEEPEVVTRTAVASGVLPAAPSVRVPLYPDPELWYSVTGETTVLWDVPDDITRVAVSVDDRPTSEPPTAEPRLVSGKKVGSFEEGVSYIHVQFQNNVGWGPVTHYRVAVDTTPPAPFTLKNLSPVSDNPSPLLSFEGSDALSGFSHALVFADGDEIARTSSTTIAAGPLRPGTHEVVVRVFDYAGNGVEDALTVEILPLETPVIDFLLASVPRNENFFVSGSAIPYGFVDLFIRTEDGREVFTGAYEVGGSGKWEAVVENTFSLGKHMVTAIARDARGATSYESAPASFRVKAESIVSFGFVDLGWFEILMFVVLVVGAGAGFFVWQMVQKEKIREAYAVVAGRDIRKMSMLIDNEVDEVLRQHDAAKDTIPPHIQSEMSYRLKNIKSITERTKKYISGDTPRKDAGVQS